MNQVQLMTSAVHIFARYADYYQGEGSGNMANPTWQRARVSNGEYKGLLHWVKVGPPTHNDLVVVADGTSSKGATFESNILVTTRLRRSRRGKPVTVTAPLQSLASCVELLPEFADDVPLVPWEQIKDSKEVL